MYEEVITLKSAIRKKEKKKKNLQNTNPLSPKNDCPTQANFAHHFTKYSFKYNFRFRDTLNQMNPSPGTYC